MKKYYTFAFLLFMILATASAQDKKWSVEASYPISVGDEFDLDGRGILDLGVRYRFLEFGRFELGASINSSLFFDSSIGNGSEDIDFSRVFLQPRLFLETRIPGLEGLRPSFGLGYTWDFFNSSNFNSFPGGDFSFTEGGLNLNLGDVYRNWFLQLQYDYIRQDLDFTINEIGLLKVGVGLRF